GLHTRHEAARIHHAAWRRGWATWQETLAGLKSCSAAIFCRADVCYSSLRVAALLIDLPRNARLDTRENGMTLFPLEASSTLWRVWSAISSRASSVSRWSLKIAAVREQRSAPPLSPSQILMDIPS